MKGKILLAALLIMASAFFMTHHRVYGNCHPSPDGPVCQLLKWQHN